MGERGRDVTVVFVGDLVHRRPVAGVLDRFDHGGPVDDVTRCDGDGRVEGGEVDVRKSLSGNRLDARVTAQGS